MGDDVSVNNSSDSRELSKNDLVTLLQQGDNNITLNSPEKFKSSIWERFRIVYYKGEKLDFVQCIGCSLVLQYRSRTGTASLLRHRCSKFPVSIQDQKQEAGRFADLLSDMASSSHNNTFELKQEILSDEESLGMQIANDDDEQQYSIEQTNKGLMESYAFLEKSFMTNEETMLSREDVETLQRTNDPLLCFERPRNHRHSSTWDRFEIVFYRDTRQNFAKCLSCSSIVSYKKTTGTASLIRHKCKVSKSADISNKGDVLVSLLSPAKTPPTLTPAPGIKISALASAMPTKPLKLETTNTSMVECAKNLAFTQIHLLSHAVLTSEVLGDPTYLSFLQNLVNFGADFGKQNISNIINREVICQQMIPHKYEAVKSDLMNTIEGTEFSISFHKWRNGDCQYVTVVGYFLTTEFEFKNQILGTREFEKDNEVNRHVKEISDGYKSVYDVKLKCVSQKDEDTFESFPCMVNEISKVVITALNDTCDRKEYFKLAEDLLKIPMKQFIDESSFVKLKVLMTLHHQLNSNSEVQNLEIAKKFTQLMGPLFAAISSLTSTSESGSRCVTANKVYLWIKKLVKIFSSLASGNDNARKIQLAIEAIEMPEVYQIAVFLDPNFKNLKFLEPSERLKLTDIVKNNLRRVIVDDNVSQPSPPKKMKIEGNLQKAPVTDTFLEFMDLTMINPVDDQINSEVQCYLGFKLENPIDVVEFWRDNECFPLLKKLARNILNLPSCTFHSDCCFLSAGNKFYEKFQNLPADQVETFTFLHQNI